MAEKKIRLAVQTDLKQILEIYDWARRFMAENGNPTQWGTSHPAQCPPRPTQSALPQPALRIYPHPQHRQSIQALPFRPSASASIQTQLPQHCHPLPGMICRREEK